VRPQIAGMSTKLILRFAGEFLAEPGAREARCLVVFSLSVEGSKWRSGGYYVQYRFIKQISHKEAGRDEI
jgi:hypothetical protein